MNPRPADAPEPVLLIIADISGYTRYMTANAKTLAHGQTIITELIHAIVHQIELPLEVAKLEGDGEGPSMHRKTAWCRATDKFVWYGDDVNKI